MASIMSTFVYPMNVVNAADGSADGYASKAWYTGAPTDGSSWVWNNHGNTFDASNPIASGTLFCEATNQNPSTTTDSSGNSRTQNAPFYKFRSGDKPFIRRMRFTAPASVLDYMCLANYPTSGVNPNVLLMGDVDTGYTTNFSFSALSLYGDLFSANEWIDINTYLPILNTDSNGYFALNIFLPWFQWEFSQKHSLLIPNYSAHAYSHYGSVPVLPLAQFELKAEVEVVHNQNLLGH